MSNSRIFLFVRCSLNKAMKTLLLGIAFVFIPCLATSQTSLQPSHIEANVPAQQVFDAILRRDLLAYFKNAGISSATSVEYQLLRSGPTQTGVSFPKYYAWVRVLVGTAFQQEGVVRLAAINRERFDVTHFVSRSEIQGKPETVKAIFPARLVPAILALTEGK